MRKIKCKGCGRMRLEYRVSLLGLIVPKERCQDCARPVLNRLLNGKDKPFWLAALVGASLPTDHDVLKFEKQPKIQRLREVSLKERALASAHFSKATKIDQRIRELRYRVER